MFPSNDPPTDDNPHDSLHERYFAPLVAAVVRDHGIPEEEAETLVDEVLVLAIRHLPTITDTETWLLAAVGYAAKRYLAEKESP